MTFLLKLHSPVNDFRALWDYSDCMKPLVQACEGPAKTAFDVITNKYTSEPYNCQLNMQTTVNAINYESNRE